MPKKPRKSRIITVLLNSNIVNLLPPAKMPRQNTTAVKANAADNDQLKSISNLTRPLQTLPIVKDPKISTKNRNKLLRTTKVTVRKKLK